MVMPYRQIGFHDHHFSNLSDVQPDEHDAEDGYVFTLLGGKPVWLPPPSGTIPIGGTTGQALAKNSGADGDIDWHDIEDLATAETDDTLVLKPDGAGGVAFGTQSSAGSRHGAAVNKASQTIGTGSTAVVTFDTEDDDTDAYHDGGTPTRLTVPTGLGGVYVIVGQGAYSSDTIGKRVLDLRVNGSTFINTNSIDPDGGLLDPTFQVVGLWPLAAGDYVELTTFQNSGGNLTLSAAMLRMYRISI